jgi:hypothetical protein
MTLVFPVWVVDFDNFKLPQAEKRVNAAILARSPTGMPGCSAP